MKIVYLGPVGSHSNTAAFSMFRAISRENRELDEFFPVESFEFIFKEIDSDLEKIAVIPLENSSAGDVNETFDRLFSGKYKIAREVYLHLNHNLLIHPEGKLENIKKLYVYPDLLQECSEFLKQEQFKNCEIVFVETTATAANIIAEKDEVESATIASAFAAEIYGLKVAKKDIGNDKKSFTRYAAIIKELAEFPPGNANKCSVIFQLQDKPGSLHEALKVLADRGYNLNKIESRHIPDEKWNYTFYIDFIFNDLLDLTDFEKLVKNMKIVGIYREGREVVEK